MSGEILQQSHEATDLLSYLLAEYRKAVKQHEPKHGEVLVDGAKQFVEFAQSFLDKDDNRPRTTFTATANVGVLLNNNVRVTIAPAVDESEDISGTMAPIAGMPVPKGTNDVDPLSYAAQGAIPISGFAKKAKSAIDYADKNYGNAVVDKTRTTTNTNFKSTRPVVHDPLNP
jgi:hypothetical protein